MSEQQASRAVAASERTTRIIYFVAGAIVIALVFWRLQFTTQAICCGDYDPYYHIRWSRLLWEGMLNGHFPPTFKWLPLTTLNPKDYDDHHLLFHILQIPFTWFGNIQLGAKIAATIFATLAVLSCYFLVIRFRLRYTLLWLVALLGCSAPFLYRMNMGKAMSLSIVFVSAGIYLLFTRKYVWLAPLAFLYVWTYSLWPLLGVAALIWAAVILWSERRLEWRPVLWVTIGCLAGLVINPYFPSNIKLFIEHIAIKVKPGNFSTDVGGEWYPYNSWEFLQYCLVAVVAMLIGYITFNASDKENGQRPLFFLIFSTVLMIMAARWRRAVEYWPPFAVLFAGFSLQPILSGARQKLAANKLPTDVLNELQPFLDRHEQPEAVEKAQRETWSEGETTIVGIGLSIALYLILMPWDKHKTVRAAVAFVVLSIALALYFKYRGGIKTAATVVALAVGICMFSAVSLTAKDIRGNNGPDHFRGGMEWIKSNVPAGQMVFNNNWDMFPKMFFYDQTHTYVSGLDPTYLLDKNPELAKLYDQIRLGKEKDPGPLIRDRFGARYVFTEYDDFYSNALDSGWFDEEYTDDDCAVLYIRDEKGAPPPEKDDEDNNTGDNNDDGDDGQQDEDNGA